MALLLLTATTAQGSERSQDHATQGQVMFNCDKSQQLSCSDCLLAAHKLYEAVSTAEVRQNKPRCDDYIW
jgi:hypothetical protein